MIPSICLLITILSIAYNTVKKYAFWALYKTGHIRYHGKYMRHDKKRFVKRSLQVFISSFVAVAIVAVLTYATQGRALPVLQPQGFIANQQYLLILITVGLGVFVVVPVFILLFTIAWRYRATNKKARYEPELDGNAKLEFIWWGVPFLIILILAVVTYISTHALDPYKPLDPDKPALSVQVISLKSNWLFIYPDYHLATLNELYIPDNTPVNLRITSDAPMNTFWVPALAGQIYAMSGMETKLSLKADRPGNYFGTTTNISGEHYADMTFTVHAQPVNDFSAWVAASAKAPSLSYESYGTLAGKTDHLSPTVYSVTTQDIFDKVVMKYMEAGAH